MGEDLINEEAAIMFRIAEKALAGEDLSALPVYADILPRLPEVEALLKTIEEMYAQQTAEIEAWLDKR